MIQLPTISVAFDFETDQWRLYATSYGATSPAGPRLFRREPPDIQFAYDTKEQAQASAGLLTKHMKDTWDLRNKRKVRSADNAA